MIQLEVQWPLWLGSWADMSKTPPGQQKWLWEARSDRWGTQATIAYSPMTNVTWNIWVMLPTLFLTNPYLCLTFLILTNTSPSLYRNEGRAPSAPTRETLVGSTKLLSYVIQNPAPPDFLFFIRNFNRGTSKITSCLMRQEMTKIRHNNEFIQRELWNNSSELVVYYNFISFSKERQHCVQPALSLLIVAPFSAMLLSSFSYLWLTLVWKY